MEKKRPPKIGQSNFGLSQHRLLEFVAEPRYGETIEAVMSDDYFSNVAYSLKTPSIIKVIPEGSTYYAELLVVDCGPVHARVKLLNYVDLLSGGVDTHQTEIKRAETIGAFTAERNGRWFRVIRNSDREAIKIGLPSMEDAVAWIEKIVAEAKA